MHCHRNRRARGTLLLLLSYALTALVDHSASLSAVRWRSIQTDSMFVETAASAKGSDLKPWSYWVQIVAELYQRFGVEWELKRTRIPYVSDPPAKRRCCGLESREGGALAESQSSSFSSSSSNEFEQPGLEGYASINIDQNPVFGPVVKAHASASSEKPGLEGYASIHQKPVHVSGPSVKGHAKFSASSSTSGPPGLEGFALDLSEFERPGPSVKGRASNSACSRSAREKGVRVFDFREWAKQNGHRAVFVGKGEWSNLTIHLDENAGGALLELVTLPLDVDGMASILTKLKTEFPIEHQGSTTESYNHLIKWVRDNFDHGWSPETDEDSMAFEYILCALSLQSLSSGLFWNNMPQITTSYTLEEMRQCRTGPVVGLYSLLGQPRNDEAMKSALMRLLYKKGGKGTSILVKHFAEQINGDADHPPPGFPKEGMDKVVPEFGLHTKANKPARLMKRGGRTAYMVELRGTTGSEEKLANLMNSISPTPSSFKSVFAKLAGCSASIRSSAPRKRAVK